MEESTSIPSFQKLKSWVNFYIWHEVRVEVLIIHSPTTIDVHLFHYCLLKTLSFSMELLWFFCQKSIDRCYVISGKISGITVLNVSSITLFNFCFSDIPVIHVLNLLCLSSVWISLLPFWKLILHFTPKFFFPCYNFSHIYFPLDLSVVLWFPRWFFLFNFISQIFLSFSSISLLSLLSSHLTSPSCPYIFILNLILWCFFLINNCLFNYI